MKQNLVSISPHLSLLLAIYLKDLTFMNDGNQSKVNGLINFDKLRMMARRVKDISGLVKNNYKFESDPTIANYIVNPIVEKDLKKLKEWALEMKET
jgi:hypothetical protein